MRSSQQISCALMVASLLAFAGCQPVREDRHITFSSDGKSVGFQHGADGVFVTGKDGTPKKIFQPANDVIATSTPLWATAGKRLVFTTATGLGKDPQPALPLLLGQRDNAAGRTFAQVPAKYTCWLRDEDADGPDAKPIPLFSANCDHVGYVAANLAVRWHPCENRLFFIDDKGTQQHALYEYDFASKTARSTFVPTADALLFDWSPDGTWLVCVLGSRSLNQPNDGIWIGKPGETDWWHVPNSNRFALPELPSLIEALRATKPAWTPDGSRFAFASHDPGGRHPDPKKPGQHSLQLVNVRDRGVNPLTESAEPFRDLFWSPDGKRLGTVRGSSAGTLHIVTPGAALSKAVNDRPVRRFAGWNSTGDRLAYVTPAPLPDTDKESWAFLLGADDMARDSVFVASGDGAEVGKEVFSGMRVTFPLWSPTENKLSLWFTFNPLYRSWLSLILGGGLRSGDPAAIFDVTNGQITWLAINGHEKVQVGHYYLLKRQYAEAWQWYEKAERELPAPTAPTMTEFFHGLRSPASAENFAFFQYHCLTKLGRTDEAKAKLDLFRKTYLPQFPVKPADNATNDPTLMFAAWAGVDKLFAPQSVFAFLLRDLYAAEVFLSLDAATDAEAYFRETLAVAASDDERLSASLALSQVLLILGKHDAYAQLAREQLVPSLQRVRRSLPAQEANATLTRRQILDVVAELACIPLMVPDFLATLPRDEPGRLATLWEKLRTQENEADCLLLDCFLSGTYRQLGRDKECQQAKERIRARPQSRDWLFDEETASQGVSELRKGMREWFRSR